MWYVYILRCGDGTFYTGSTDDVERRLAVHRSRKGAKYTRGRGPLELVYQEALPDRSSALRRAWKTTWAELLWSEYASAVRLLTAQGPSGRTKSGVRYSSPYFFSSSSLRDRQDSASPTGVSPPATWYTRAKGRA